MLNFLFFYEAIADLDDNQVSADSSAHHQSLWQWILRPQSYYHRGNRGTKSPLRKTTRYPYAPTLRYQYGTNPYYSAFNPYSNNIKRKTYPNW